MRVARLAHLRNVSFFQLLPITAVTIIGALIVILNPTPTSAIATCTVPTLSDATKTAVKAYSPTVDLKNGSYSWVAYQRPGLPDLLNLSYDVDNLATINQYAYDTSKLWIGGNGSSDYHFVITLSTGAVSRTTGSFGEREISCIYNAKSTYNNPQSPSTWQHGTLPSNNTWLDIPLPEQDENTMYRDTSNLPATSICYHIVDDMTLEAWTATNTKKTYKLVADTYYLTTTTTETVPASYSCYTDIAYVNMLKSRYDFLSPILHTMAIASFLAIVYFAYRLIIYPFYRKGV